VLVQEYLCFVETEKLDNNSQDNDATVCNGLTICFEDSRLLRYGKYEKSRQGATLPAIQGPVYHEEGRVREISLVRNDSYLVP